MCSDLDFEGMVVYVNYDEQTLASINYDKGINNLEVEMFPFEYEGQKLIFPLQDFLAAIEKARKLALKCAEEDQLKK